MASSAAAAGRATRRRRGAGGKQPSNVFSAAGLPPIAYNLTNTPQLHGASTRLHSFELGFAQRRSLARLCSSRCFRSAQQSTGHVGKWEVSLPRRGAVQEQPGSRRVGSRARDARGMLEANGGATQRDQAARSRPSLMVSLLAPAGGRTGAWLPTSCRPEASRGTVLLGHWSARSTKPAHSHGWLL